MEMGEKSVATRIFETCWSGRSRSLLGGMARTGRVPLMGEFGATLMFAGSFAGVTQTAPLAIYDQFANDLPAALALSAVLVAASAVLLGAIKFAARGSPRALGVLR